jgi:hypothetical protein
MTGRGLKFRGSGGVPLLLVALMFLLLVAGARHGSAGNAAALMTGITA